MHAVGTLVPVEVHFDELDAMGLLHNSRYQVLVERAWVGFWYAQGLGGANGRENDAINVVKAFTITYDTPVTTAGPYAVDLWIDRLGSTSGTAGHRVCAPDGETTYAHGTRTVIRLAPATFLPTPWSARPAPPVPQALQHGDEHGTVAPLAWRGLPGQRAGPVVGQ